MVFDSGVHAFLLSNFQQQVIYTKFDLKIIYPPSYEWKMQHFQHANCDHIKRVVGIFDWECTLNYIDAID